MDKETIAALIISMEESALSEWNKGNPSGYLDILADDITYFDPLQEKRIDGFNKMHELYEGLRGKGQVEKSEILNPVVQISEKMAVLSYNLESYAKGILYKWNCTEVYRLEPEGKWKIIHNHWSITRPMDMKQ